MGGTMIAEVKKRMEAGTESPLDEALRLSGEVVALRSQLVAARREHAALLEQREESLSEGIDLLPQIRVKHLEIEKLPSEIARLEERIRWLVDQEITKVNAENIKTAGQHYIKSRDALRQALERFREDFVAVQANIKAGENMGPSQTDAHNTKLAEIENTLGGVHFSRVTYQFHPLPPLDHELVRQNQLLAAFDRWAGALH
jgi:chromosome segregation ATPase